MCFLQRQLWSGCSGSGDYVELLGGNGVDTSKMFPVADLCFSLSGLGESQFTSSVCDVQCKNRFFYLTFPYYLQK